MQTLFLLSEFDAAQAVALALLVSCLIDHIWGEPAAKWHPVVWMGQYLDFVGRRIVPVYRDALVINFKSIVWQSLLGSVTWLLAAISLVWLALQAQYLLASLDWPWRGLILGILLKPLFSWRMLRDEVRAVEMALQLSINAGRARLARLVSREVNQLNTDEVRESAIETLAENLNDSFISPLLWFLVAGLPGAVLYRFANTADAMWGYRGVRGGRCWTWAGMWAARADDVLSWPGARCTAIFMYWGQTQWPDYRLGVEAGKTTSPNGGWPMAAMALLLDIRLTKPGVYVLHEGGSAPDDTHIKCAIEVCERAICCWFGVAAGFLLGSVWMKT
jgi:adenosylcobinamide-phosphate synthase